jgi:hypothetical protein
MTAVAIAPAPGAKAVSTPVTQSSGRNDVTPPPTVCTVPAKSRPSTAETSLLEEEPIAVRCR